MGLRFRKSFKILPGVKINFNKNSTSITFGDKGVHYTVNSKGKRTGTFGIPGTGIYYTTSSSSRRKAKSNTPASSKSSPISYKTLFMDSRMLSSCRCGFWFWDKTACEIYANQFTGNRFSNYRTQ